MSLQDYEPGDIIQGGCVPFCKTVCIPSQKGRICDECFKDPDETGRSLQNCSGCKRMHYCSKECQTSDWKNGHKIECKSNIFKNSFESRRSVEFRCQLIRVLGYLKMDPELAVKGFSVYDGTTRCFQDLLSHEVYPESSPIHGVCVQLATEIADEDGWGGEVVGNTKAVLKVAGILQTNAFAIYNKDETVKLGTGIYIEPSIFNHSCRPNALFCVKGTRMEIRALAPIKKGEEPFISYIAKHMGKTDRKATLMSRYKFNCQCERCESDDDFGVNFRKLNDLIEFFNLCQVGIGLPISFGQILSKHRTVIQMMKKMYSEYDDRVTNQYYRTVRSLISGGYCNMDVAEIRKLVEDTQFHLKISYGEDHADYLNFERAINLNNGGP